MPTILSANNTTAALWGGGIGIFAAAFKIHADGNGFQATGLDLYLGGVKAAESDIVRARFYTDDGGLPGAPNGPTWNFSVPKDESYGFLNNTFTSSLAFDINETRWLVITLFDAHTSQIVDPIVPFNVTAPDASMNDYTYEWAFSTSIDVGVYFDWTLATEANNGPPFVLYGDVLLPPEKAITPFYENTENKVANGVDLNDFLSWEDGGSGLSAATSYDVLFGTDFGFPGTATKVAEGITVLGYVIPENIHQILGDIPIHWLNSAQKYKWRIDAINGAGTTTGDEWEFTTTATIGLGGAHTPTPIDTATGIKSTIGSLTWKGCEGSSKNTLYLGTAPGQLSKVKGLGGSTLTTQISSLHLVPGETYYWRIDTSRGGVNNTTLSVTGNEWFFILDNDMTHPPLYGVGGLPTIRLLTALTDTCLWYEDLI